MKSENVLYFPKRPILYVAGPMTSSGCAYRNVGLGYAAGLAALQMGWAPFIPQGDAILSMMLGFSGEPAVPYETFMNLDFTFVQISQGLLRLPGVSPGGDREVALAQSLGIPVYTDVNDLPIAVVRPV